MGRGNGSEADLVLSHGSAAYKRRRCSRCGTTDSLRRCRCDEIISQKQLTIFDTCKSSEDWLWHDSYRAVTFCNAGFLFVGAPGCHHGDLTSQVHDLFPDASAIYHSGWVQGSLELEARQEEFGDGTIEVPAGWYVDELTSTMLDLIRQLNDLPVFVGAKQVA